MHVESTLLARARRLELSPATFRKLALATVAWLWLIVVTGATVRLTASGLGCEHWPGCTAGNPFPSKSYHSFIEFGNRIVSALTILATLVGWVGARFTPGVPRWVRRLALGTFLGTLAQAPLGAITVYSDLNPLLVMSHFLLALVVLAAGVVVAVEAVSFERGRAEVRLPRRDQARRAPRGRSAARARRHRHRRDRCRTASRRLGRRAAVAPARRRVRARARDGDLRTALSRVRGVRRAPPRALAALRRERRRVVLPVAAADGRRRAAVPHGASLVARADPRRPRRRCLGLRGRAGGRHPAAAKAVRARKLPRWPTS